ncbi:MAG: hypothetical protein V1663_05315 [archaeon]
MALDVIYLILRMELFMKSYVLKMMNNLMRRLRSILKNWRL